ncbi:hypothetical protein ACFLUS_02830 [Chloroflexota bacterium]
MIDWGIVAKMWGGYGVTILALIIISLVAWVAGMIIQKCQPPKEEKAPAKEK